MESSRTNMLPRAEYLLHNVLEKDFQKMLIPYYYAQKLLCVSKYHLENNFVTPNTKKYCIMNIFTVFIITCIYVHDSTSRACTLEGLCPFIVFTEQLLAYFISTATAIYQSVPVTKLLIKMQNTDMKFKILVYQISLTLVQKTGIV